MFCPGEKVHRLHRFHAVSGIRQGAGVPGGGGGVAADHHDGAGGHVHQCLQSGLVAAFAGRVHHDHIGAGTFRRKAGGGGTGVHAVEVRFVGAEAQPGRSFLGSVHRLGHHFHPYQPAAVRQHGKPDGAHAAVQIQQEIIRAQSGEPAGGGIQLFRRRGVYLVELMHAHAQRYPGQGILDGAGAQDCAGALPQNYIGAGGVAVDKHRGQIELFLQCGADLGFVGQAVAVGHKAEQPLAAVPALPHVQVTHPALAGFFVIRLHPVLFQQGTGPGGQLVHPDRLQQTVGGADDAVAAPGVEPGDHVPVTVPSHRQLYLVAVPLHQGRGQNLGHRHIQSAQTGEGVPHKAGFGFTLCLIGDVPQAASSAGSAHRAVRFAAAGTGNQQLFHPGKSVAFQRLGHPGLDAVAGGGAGHEYRHALPAAHAAAVAGKSVNIQLQQLVLFQKGRGLIRHNTPRVVQRWMGRKQAQNAAGALGRKFTAGDLFPARPGICWAVRP